MQEKVEILGGNPSLAGQVFYLIQFLPISVTVLHYPKSRGEENKVVLPPPLHEEKFKGKIMLVKTDDEANYIDLSVDEWEEYKNKDHSKELKLYNEGEEEEGDIYVSEEEEDEDEDEYDEEDDD